jgi:hypothetical protein
LSADVNAYSQSPVVWLQVPQQLGLPLPQVCPAA